MIHPIQLIGMYFYPGEWAKHTFALRKSGKKNVFKRSFDLNKRSGSRGVGTIRKSTGEVVQQKRKIDSGSMTRYPAGCAGPGGISCIAAHALKHVLTQLVSFPNWLNEQLAQNNLRAPFAEQVTKL